MRQTQTVLISVQRRVRVVFIDLTVSGFSRSNGSSGLKASTQRRVWECGRPRFWYSITETWATYSPRTFLAYPYIWQGCLSSQTLQLGRVPRQLSFVCKEERLSQKGLSSNTGIDPIFASYLFSGIAPQRYIFIECIVSK